MEEKSQSSEEPQRIIPARRPHEGEVGGGICREGGWLEVGGARLQI